MKRFFTALLILTSLFGIISCTKSEDERKIIAELADIPTTAQEFISKHFKGVEAAYIEENGGTYNVSLRNNTQLVFSNTGDWRKVACYGDAVPSSILGLLPEKITSLLAGEKYKGYYTTNVSKEGYGYRLNLRSPATELKFDNEGNPI